MHLDQRGGLGAGERRPCRAVGIELTAVELRVGDRRLGVVADRYLLDFYGAEAASFLHQTGTDRLWVSWWLTSDHVKRTISGDRTGLPGEISIEIPHDINSLQQQDPRTALKWREETRASFTEAMAKGYKVVGFVRENNVGRYLLSCKS